MFYECIGVVAGLALTLYVAVQLWCPWILYDIVYIWRRFKIIRCTRNRIRRRQFIIDSFERHVQTRPKKTFIIFEDEHFSYEDVDANANKVARLGLNLGLKPKDVVAIMMHNGPEFVWTFLGFQKIGVTISFINYHLRFTSLVYSVKSCNPKFLIVGKDDTLTKALTEIRSEVTTENMVVYEYDDFIKMADDMPRDTVDPEIRKCLTMSDISTFIFTSGTTGLPKPAVISHQRNLMGASAFEIFDFSPDDILYETLPLYHAAGLNLGVLGTISKGATVVLGRKFSVGKFWSDCRKHNVTVIQYIGEMCRYLVSTPQHPLDGEHKIRVAAGNGLRADIWTQFQNRFKIPEIYEFYASVEGNTNFINIFNKVGVVGRLSPLLRRLTFSTLIKYDCRTQRAVRDCNGRCVEVGPGHVGLLICSITRLTPFAGYYKKPKETEKCILRNVFKEGDAYLNSGDLFYVDSEYFIYFQDRIGDTFRWKGENVSTSEVANVMSEIGFIHDVNVYGVNVPGCEGKAGMAAVCLKDGEEIDDRKMEEINECVHDKLPGYARPRFLRVMRQMSLTSTYKQVKMDLAEESFNPEKVQEPLYYYDSKNSSYKPLVDTVYENIVACKMSV